MAPRALLPASAIAIALAGCGGGGGSDSGGQPKVAGDADPGDVRVIDGWVTALRHGDVDAAARYFAIPSVAENGPLLLHIRSLDEARRFNESLPCGARLVRAETPGQFTTATFRLTERPGRASAGRAPGSREDLVRDPRRQDRRVAPGRRGQRKRPSPRPVRIAKTR